MAIIQRELLCYNVVIVYATLITPQTVISVIHKLAELYVFIPLSYHPQAPE